MIEFRGEISDECKRYILKNETKTASRVSLIVTVIVSVPLAIAAIKWDSIFALFIALPVIMTIFASIPQTKKFNSRIPKRLTIRDGVIDCGCEREEFSQVRSVEDVKKVIDYDTV